MFMLYPGLMAVPVLRGRNVGEISSIVAKNRFFKFLYHKNVLSPMVFKALLTVFSPVKNVICNEKIS